MISIYKRVYNPALLCLF